MASFLDERLGLWMKGFKDLHGRPTRPLTVVQPRPPLVVRTVTGPAAAQQSWEPTQAIAPAPGPNDRRPALAIMTQTRPPSKVSEHARELGEQNGVLRRSRREHERVACRGNLADGRSLPTQEGPAYEFPGRPAVARAVNPLQFLAPTNHEGADRPDVRGSVGGDECRCTAKCQRCCSQVAPPS